MSLRFHLSVSIDSVWAACVEPNQLKTWFGSVSGNLYAGGIAIIDIGMPKKVTSRILHCDGPRRISITWAYGDPHDNPDEVEVRLKTDNAGTIVELVHRSVGQNVWAGVGPGWEDWMLKLSFQLMGGDPALVPSEELEPRLVKAWASVVIGNPRRHP